MFPLSVVVCSLLALAAATDVQQCSGESLHKSIIARPAFVSAYIRRKYSCDMLRHNGDAPVGLTASKLTAVRSVPYSSLTNIPNQYFGNYNIDTQNYLK